MIGFEELRGVQPSTARFPGMRSGQRDEAQEARTAWGQAKTYYETVKRQFVGAVALDMAVIDAIAKNKSSQPAGFKAMIGGALNMWADHGFTIPAIYADNVGNEDEGVPRERLAFLGVRTFDKVLAIETPFVVDYAADTDGDGDVDSTLFESLGITFDAEGRAVQSLSTVGDRIESAIQARIRAGHYFPDAAERFGWLGETWLTRNEANKPIDGVEAAPDETGGTGLFA